MKNKLNDIFKPPTEDECWERLMAIDDIKEAVKNCFDKPDFLKQIFPLANLPAFDHEIYVPEDIELRNDYEEIQYQLQRIIFGHFDAFLLALEHHIIFPYQFKEIYEIINELAAEINAILDHAILNEGSGLHEVFAEGELIGVFNSHQKEEYMKRYKNYDQILSYIVQHTDDYD